MSLGSLQVETPKDIKRSKDPTDEFDLLLAKACPPKKKKTPWSLPPTVFQSLEPTESLMAVTASSAAMQESFSDDWATKG